MAKMDRKDDGRRCHQCKGPALNGILPRYRLKLIDEKYDGVRDVDMHDICVGSYLSSNEGQKRTAQFISQEIR